MPVIGHAFVGLAIAREFHSARRTTRASPQELASWTSLIVVLAYLPDIVTQIGSSMGWAHAGVAGHSVFVGSIMAVVCCTVWAALVGAPPLRIAAIGVATILLHDALDVLQATDRAPFWPLSGRLVTAGGIRMPNRLFSELILFGVPFLGYLLWRSRIDARTNVAARLRADLSRRVLWMSRAIVVLLVAGAALTYVARGHRERQLNAAERLLRRGEYARALSTMEAADEWPRSARPGRIDMLRGEAYEALGDTRRAEALYLRAYENDPTSFWVVADIAEFYASSRRPAAERRRLAQPYVDELRRNFAAQRALPDVLARIDRKLDLLN